MIARSLCAALGLAFGAACSAPAPDPAGAIACGAADECPADFECRFGRCCPASSALEQCPAPAYTPDPGTDGRAFACDAMGRCPAGHDYACRFGRCCPANGGTGVCDPRAVGNACHANSDCGTSDSGSAIALCLDAIGDNHAPGGYCSAYLCTDLAGSSCGPNGHCLVLGTVLGTACVAECVFPAGAPFSPCRFDGAGAGTYGCFPVLGDSATAHVGLCLPDCTRDATICASGTGCDAATHFCEHACHVDADCAAQPGGHARCAGGFCQFTPS